MSIQVRKRTPRGESDSSEDRLPTIQELFSDSVLVRELPDDDELEGITKPVGAEGADATKEAD